MIFKSFYLKPLTQFAILILFVALFQACGPNTAKSEEHLRKGIDLIYKAKHQNALDELNLAIKYNASSAEAYYYRGACKRNLQNHEGAMEDYKKAVELMPDYADAHFSLGQLYDYFQDRKMACYHYLKAETLGRPNMNEFTRWCK